MVSVNRDLEDRRLVPISALPCSQEECRGVTINVASDDDAKAMQEFTDGTIQGGAKAGTGI